MDYEPQYNPKLRQALSMSAFVFYASVAVTEGSTSSAVQPPFPGENA
jgi:hypothetical protein